jgi:hypothetical protein
MPIGIREMNPAIPLAALCTTPLSGNFAGYLLLRNSLTQPLLRIFRKFFHGDLPQKGGPELIGLMVSHIWDAFPSSSSANSDQDLVLEEKRLRNEGTDPARTEQPNQDGDEMDEKNGKIAHQRIVAGRRILRNHGSNNNSPGTHEFSHATPSVPRESLVSPRPRASVTAVPSSRGCGKAAGEGIHSNPWSASGSDEKNGDPAPRG